MKKKMKLGKRTVAIQTSKYEAIDMTPIYEFTVVDSIKRGTKIIFDKAEKNLYIEL